MPEGFAYNVLGKTGSAMSDGRPTPRAHDGMAAFKVRGELRLVRNTLAIWGPWKKGSL